MYDYYSARNPVGFLTDRIIEHKIYNDTNYHFLLKYVAIYKYRERMEHPNRVVELGEFLDSSGHPTKDFSSIKLLRPHELVDIKLRCAYADYNYRLGMTFYYELISPFSRDYMDKVTRQQPTIVYGRLIETDDGHISVEGVPDVVDDDPSTAFAMMALYKGLAMAPSVGDFPIGKYAGDLVIFMKDIIRYKTNKNYIFDVGYRTRLLKEVEYTLKRAK